MLECVFVCVYVRYHHSLAIIMVLEFPPRLSFSSHVSTESLYGTKTDFFFRLVLGPSADMSAGQTDTHPVNANTSWPDV